MLLAIPAAIELIEFLCNAPEDYHKAHVAISDLVDEAKARGDTHVTVPPEHIDAVTAAGWAGETP